jgi:hypothetical protein
MYVSVYHVFIPFIENTFARHLRTHILMKETADWVGFCVEVYGINYEKGINMEV